MATVSLFLDTRNTSSEKHPLVLRVAHKSRRKDLPSGYKLALNEWNDSKKTIKGAYPNSSRANARLKTKIAVATEAISEYESVLKDMTAIQLAAAIRDRLDALEKQKLPTTNFVNAFSGKTMLKAYGEKVIARYEKAKRFGMANSIKDAVDVLLRYHGNENLLLSDINEVWLEDLEADYVSKGNKINGLGVRLRAIRRIYNLAIKDSNVEISADGYPFGRSGYSIKREKTKKRAVKLDVIDAIRALNYEKNSSLWHHRNYFLFMLNLRGMNFIDLAFLKREAIQDGRLKYQRRKTKRGLSVKEFSIKITEEASEILSYYSADERAGGLVFPIMEDVIDSEDDRRIYTLYQNRLRNHNRRLNSIGKAIGLDTRLTTYVARHTFATAGLRKGVSKAQIGDMLGHTNYYTTEAYFDEFDEAVLDRATEHILG